MQNLLLKFKAQTEPEKLDERMLLGGYEQYLRENVLTPLQALKVGCMVVVMSAKEIWHEARMADSNKGPHEVLNIPKDSDVDWQLKVFL